VPFLSFLFSFKNFVPVTVKNRVRVRVRVRVQGWYRPAIPGVRHSGDQVRVMVRVGLGLG